MENESPIAKRFDRPIGLQFLVPAAAVLIAIVMALSAMQYHAAPLSIWLLLSGLQAAAIVYLLYVRYRGLSNVSQSYGDKLPNETGSSRGESDILVQPAHRVQNIHSVSGLPTREILIRTIRNDIDNGLTQGLLGVIRFSDYPLLLDFDEKSALEFLSKMLDRLMGATGSHLLLSQVDHGTIAIWFAGSDKLEQKQIELAALSYALRNELVVDNNIIRPTIETGSVTFPDDGTEAKILLRRAISTINLRRSNSGTTSYSKSTEDDAKYRYNLVQKMAYAIDNDELQLHYQPIVNLAAGKVTGAEALLRWPQPDGAMLSPAVFIPIIEESDLSDRLGLWTINTACREAGQWDKTGMGHTRIAVNVSARQLHSAKLSDTILRSIQLHDFDPKRLELELTETAAMADIEFSAQLFETMRARGISISIDDFGAGYSSFTYLKNLPFDKLKIDREFVKDVDRCNDNQAICAALIALGRGLGIAVLAEGVERKEEVDALASLGCVLFQGYYFSRPLPAQRFAELGRDVELAEKLLPPSATRRNQIANERLTA